MFWKMVYDMVQLIAALLANGFIYYVLVYFVQFSYIFPTAFTQKKIFMRLSLKYNKYDRSLSFENNSAT